MKFMITLTSFNSFLSTKIKRENISASIFFLWCIMPIIVSFYCLINGILGNFPPLESIKINQVYIAVILFSHKLFYIYSVPTILYAILICPSLFFSSTEKYLSRRSPWFILLFILLLWAILSTSLSANPLWQFFGSELVGDGLYTYFVYASMFIIACSIRTERIRHLILIVFTTVVTYLSVILLLQQAEIPFILYCFINKGASVFQNTNYMGYILCISIIALFGLYLTEFSTRKRLVFLLSFTIQVIALLFNDTFGSYLAVLLTIPIVLFLDFKRTGKTTFSSFIPFIIFGFASLIKYGFFSSDFRILYSDIQEITHNGEHADQAGSLRWILWKGAVSRILKRPLFGYGPEGFAGDNLYTNDSLPHNDFLQIAGFLGVPALVFYLSSLLSLAAHLWKKIKNLSDSTLIISGIVFCYMFSAFVGHPVYNTTPYFWFFLGAISTQDLSINTPAKLHSPHFSHCKHFVIKHKKRLISTFFVVYLTLILLFTYSSILRHIEHELERSDIQALNCANNLAAAYLRDGKVSFSGDYWYDANTFSFSSIKNDPPAFYGMGTTKDGFTQEYLSTMTYDYSLYDSSVDYQHKIITVYFDLESATYSLSWVEIQ